MSKKKIHTRRLISILCGNGVDPEWGAEIGVKFGKNSYWLLEKFPRLRMILVDHYPEILLGKNKKRRYKRKTEPEVLIQTAIENLAEFESRTLWIYKPSAQAAQEVQDSSLDFVFIDAEHTYEAVMEDILVWRPKVKKGGILVGHDVRKMYPGVKKAVQEIFGKDFGLVGDVWFVKV